MPTSSRSGPPSDFVAAWTRSRTVARSPTGAATAPTPVGARYSPNTSRSAPAHSPTVPPARASAIVAGTRFSSSRARRRARASSAARAAASSRAARHACEVLDLLALGRRVDDHDASARESSDASGDGSVSVKQLTPTTVRSPDSMRRTRSALLCTSRPFISSIISNEPPPSSTHSSSADAASDELGDLRLDDLRSVEEVAVLEQVGLVREHLLHAQRPLLVPRRRQTERLVPARQLDRAGAGVLRERHAEHLEHDALHVVLGLLLGEPERVHLHAVAEAAQLRVGDAVALERMRSHSSVNARILHISSTKRTPASMKNEMRPTTSGNSSSGT